jgi:signal transduction histidine kinase
VNGSRELSETSAAGSAGSAGGSWDRLAPAVAWAIFAVTAVEVAVALTLDVLNGEASSIAISVPFLTFPVVGLMLATRRPRNPLGWLMLGVAVLFVFPGESYAAYATTGGRDLPGAAWALGIASPLWVPFIGLSGFMLLLFPDGHLPTTRWRWFGRICAAGLLALFLLMLLGPGTFEDSGFPHITNPFGIQALEPFVTPLLVLVVFAPLSVVGGAVALIRRRRRTVDPTQRLQLRWLTWSAAVIAVAYVAAFLPQLVFGLGSESVWADVLGTIAVGFFALIPVTIGIAVLRYRLYDIDFVIKKTVVFAIVAAFIAAVYVGIVAGVGTLVGSRGNPFLSALAAGVVALVFQPVRTQARRFADRVVYGRRATPYELLSQFGDRLSETYAADDVLPRTAKLLAEGIGADRARVWLVVDGELRPVATWTREGADPSRSDDHRTEVRHQGELLGALSVVMPPSDPMDPSKVKLMSDLAAQAGLLLRNVRLVEELRASARRLVSAQDQERRRLERNIHDGAQQQLVALAVKLKLADALVDRDAARARELLGQLHHESQTALSDLRDLARGIYPPLLADKGLPAALEAQVARVPLSVALVADGVPRYPQEIEAAVYFSVLESLQNASKYAEATRVEVALSAADTALTFRVSDDGRGFDAASHRYGTGLQGMVDRLVALGGSLAVESSPGRGTTVTGRLPAEPMGASRGAETDDAVERSAETEVEAVSP